MSNIICKSRSGCKIVSRLVEYDGFGLDFKPTLFCIKKKKMPHH